VEPKPAAPMPSEVTREPIPACQPMEKPLRLDLRRMSEIESVPEVKVPKSQRGKKSSPPSAGTDKSRRSKKQQAQAAPEAAPSSLAVTTAVPAPDPANACQSVAMQAAVNAVNCSNDYRPRGNISPQQVVKLRRQFYGGGPAAWLAYEKLLRVCEPHHLWRWMPDKDLSAFWRMLPPEVQAEVTEVKSQSFRFLIKEHIGMRTCYIKDLMAICNEVYMLDDTHSIAVFQEFFRIAVSEDACIAVNWQTVQAIDSTIQDFIKARVVSGELQDRVDPRDFPKGSFLWCQHREREHTRLTLMCLTLEIFERRLLTMWERRHGAARRRAARKAAEVQKASEEASDLLALEGNMRRSSKGSTTKSREEDEAAWKAAEAAANQLISMEENEAARKAKGKTTTSKRKKQKKAEEAVEPAAALEAVRRPPGRGRREDLEVSEQRGPASGQKSRRPTKESRGGTPAQTTVDDSRDTSRPSEAASASASAAPAHPGARAPQEEVQAAAAEEDQSQQRRNSVTSTEEVSLAPASNAEGEADVDPDEAADGDIEADDGDGEEVKSDKELAQEIQQVQARVDAEDGDEIDAEFNRLVLEHLKARAVKAQDEVVDAHRSATVIKKLCLKLEEGLQTAIMGHK